MTYLSMAIMFFVFAIVAFVGAIYDTAKGNEIRSIYWFFGCIACVVAVCVLFALHFG